MVRESAPSTKASHNAATCAAVMRKPCDCNAAASCALPLKPTPPAPASQKATSAMSCELSLEGLALGVDLGKASSCPRPSLNCRRALRPRATACTIDAALCNVLILCSAAASIRSTAARMACTLSKASIAWSASTIGPNAPKLDLLRTIMPRAAAWTRVAALVWRSSATRLSTSVAVPDETSETTPAMLTAATIAPSRSSG
mmetsp:Transcript_35252/g.101551  ORF Transcript_35252/g.101551 Transcript_35252/m.101551 type:complete len:201 (-) Transcript_35252:73-675(-)